MRVSKFGGSQAILSGELAGKIFLNNDELLKDLVKIKLFSLDIIYFLSNFGNLVV